MATLASWLALGISSLPSEGGIIGGLLQELGISVGPGDSNTGPHTRVTNSFTMELLPARPQRTLWEDGKVKD